MLRSLKDLEHFTVGASDGDIGSVGDFYFDDDRWAVRYLVVETGGFWHDRKQVLVSPLAFREADWSTRRFHLALTGEKVKHSPDAAVDKPVSRQFEQDYFRFYGWPNYWGGDGLWGNWAYPGQLAMVPPSGLREDLAHSDPHLRSLREVIGYHLQGTDGELGHIKDMIVDDRNWAIRYLVIDTSNWWIGKKVLLPPHWVERISWAENQVYVSLPREDIKNSPEWLPEQPVNRAYETRLYDYYGRPAYWLNEGKDSQEGPDGDSLSGRYGDHG
jgi:hypothetical protein